MLFNELNLKEEKGEKFVVDERRMLEIIKRMGRCCKIMKVKRIRFICCSHLTIPVLQLLVEQVSILETMSPVDFFDFRDYLSTGSGFQSLQFRLLENKLGVKQENRVKYNQSNYRRVFDDIPGASEQLEESETSPSLSQCIESWLERTPGLEEDGFNFPEKFSKVVEQLLNNDMNLIEVCCCAHFIFSFHFYQ